MILIMRKILVALFVSFCTTLMAQNAENTDSQLFYRGAAACDNGDYEEAIKYFNKDLEENPESGHTYSYLAWSFLNIEEYEKALAAADMAVKYIAKNDTAYLIFNYTTRGQVNMFLYDTASALADYATAINICPNDETLYLDRSYIYYSQKKYTLAEADYQKLIELKPDDELAYFCSGRNFNLQGRYADAIKRFDSAIKIANDDSEAYALRAQSYLGLEKWNEATDDLIRAIAIDWNVTALNTAQGLRNPAAQILMPKIKMQLEKKQDDPAFTSLMGTLYQNERQFKDAISWYITCSENCAVPNLFMRISDCYKELGMFEDALVNINKSISITNEVDMQFYQRRADIYYEMGNVKSALADINEVLSHEVLYGWGYYRRGWFKEISGDIDKAIEDYSWCIRIDPKYAYAYIARGSAYKRQGKNDLAMADFKTVVEMEDSPYKAECVYFAYPELSEPDKAVAAINTAIAEAPTDSGVYYDAACLYSRMQDKANALKYLEKSLELGFARFFHIEKDFDLDFISNTDEFKALINKYKGAHKSSE